MSYSTWLAKIFGKRPIWLYRLTLGSTTVHLTTRQSDYYSPHDDFFDLGPDLFAHDDFFGQTFTASPLSHTKIPVTSKLDRSELKMEFPLSDSFASQFLGIIGLVEATVTIWHAFEDDPDRERVVKYRGRIMEVRPSPTRIEFSVENELTAMRRKGLVAVMQRPCRHALYHGDPGEGCGLNIADFETSASATAASGVTVTVTEAGDQPDGYYTGGVITYDSQRQMILSHTGTALVLIATLPGLEDEVTAWGSATVKLAPGCDLTRDTCNDRFDNIVNFGGFPWMGDNPFDGRSVY